MRTWIVLLGLAAAGCAGPAVDPAAPDPVTLYRRAAGRLDAGDAAAALPMLDEALRQRPDFAAAFAARSTARQQLGDVAGAVEDLGAALKLAPGTPALLVARGLLLERLRRPEEALKDYDELVAKLPGEPDGYVLRSRLHRAAGRFAEAEADQATAQARGKAKWNRFYNAGNEEARAGRGEDALLQYELALVLAPECGEAWLGISRVHAEAGRIEQALEAAGRAIALRPSEPDFRYARGELLRHLGRHAEAESEYDAALERRAGAHALVGRALCAEARGRIDAALADLDAAAAAEPGYRDTYVARARVRAALGRKDDARADLVKALEILATPDVLGELARWHADRDERREALYYYDHAIQLARPGPARDRLAAARKELAEKPK